MEYAVNVTIEKMVNMHGIGTGSIIKLQYVCNLIWNNGIYGNVINLPNSEFAANNFRIYLSYAIIKSSKVVQNVHTMF